MTLILIATAIAFALLAVYPFLLYPRVLAYLLRNRAARPAPKGDASGLVAPSADCSPRFSLCVSAYNEEGVIADKARDMLAQRAAVPDLELLVYVDGATDRTVERLAPFADAIRIVPGAVRKGKSHGMNELVRRATGSVIVFSDANVMLAPDAIASLAGHFRDPEVGCVCGTLAYENPQESATAEVNSLYWRLEERLKQLESRSGGVMGADGSLFAIRRHLHRPVPPDIIDDFYISLSILCDGYRVVSAPDVRARERAVTGSGDEVRRKIRIGCQAFNVHRLLWPRLSRLKPLLLFQYVSHKLLRWFAGLNLVLAGLAGLAGLALAAGWTGLAGAGIAVAVLGLGLWLGVRPLPQSMEILLGLLATSLGVLFALAGARFQTWSPVGSARLAKADKGAGRAHGGKDMAGDGRPGRP